MTIKRVFSVSLSVITATVLLGCGGDLEFAPTPKTQIPPIIHHDYNSASVAKPLPGSYIVAFRTDLSASALQFATYLREYQTHYDVISTNLISEPGVKEIQFITSVDLNARSLRKDDFGGYAPKQLQFSWAGEEAPIVASLARVDFNDHGSAKLLLDQWLASGRVWFAEPNYLNKLATNDNVFTQYKESYKKSQTVWHKRIHLVEAFEALSQKNVVGDPPIIAILDSGLDYLHADLKDRAWQNGSVGSAGCINDVYGCNTTVTVKGVLGDGDVFPVDASGPGTVCPAAIAGNSNDDNCQHGTHVAGIVAGLESTTGTSRGGVCPVCQVLPVRIVGRTPGGEVGALDSSILAGLKYVALFRKSSNLAIRVVNASFGKFARSRSVDVLVRLLSETGSGALVIGAAGNEDVQQMSYPAAFSDALAVAAVDDQDQKAAFSNFGSWVDISAPGVAIYSTIPGGSYVGKSGTSMASPVVAGVAGLILASEPNITAGALKDRLQRTADPTIYSPNNTINQYYYPRVSGEDFPQPLLGYGIVDAFAAVNNAPTKDLPVYAGLDRVTSQCGTISSKPRRFEVLTIGLLLLLPVGMIGFRKTWRLR